MELSQTATRSHPVMTKHHALACRLRDKTTTCGSHISPG